MVANFTLAVDRAFDRDKSDFINCVAWGKTAELVVQYMKKGRQLGVVGELNIDEYEGKYYTKVNVDRITFIDGKKEQEPEKDTKDDDFPMIDDADVPF